MREERERAALFRVARSGGAVAEAVRQATEQQKLLRGLDLDTPYRGLIDALERDRTVREAFRKLASTAWALSVTETARGVAERNSALVEEQRRLSSTILDTVRTFDANRSAIGAAIAAATAGPTYKQMIAEALPRVSILGAIAERMLMVDVLTLRASEDVAQSATALAAEMVVEAQRIAEAIADAPTEEEGVRLYETLVDVLLQFLSNLGPNTIPELQRMGLVGFISFVITVLSLSTLVPQEPTQSPQDTAAFTQLNEKVDQLQEEVRHYHEVEAQSEEHYLANLPRAELTRNATFRRRPARDGEVVLRASRGMEVAIARAEGRWRLVVFRDPLSDQLAQAWVYATAVAPLAPPLSATDRR
jgi:hypothetical protein